MKKIKVEKETILFGRLGNKDQDNKYYKHLLPFDNIKTVIEPFAGSFSIIRNFYNDSDKYELLANDNDISLNKIYNNPEQYKELKNKFIEIVNKNKDENDGYPDCKKIILEFDKLDYDEDIKNQIKNSMIVRGSIPKIPKKYNPTKLIDLMKNINFTNQDYKDVINKYKYDENAFIYIDPPYMFSDNTQYLGNERDNTDIPFFLSDIFKDKKTKAKIMIIINKMKMNEILFNGFIKFEYNKTYSLSKKKDILLVITNY